MITIFTIPKPFKGHIKVIQTNAILSWLKLYPKCQVILFGNEEGIAEAAKELGTEHVPDLKRNEFGTPLLDHVFKTAHEIARHDTLCYANADIILMNGFIEAVNLVQKKKRRFLIVGQRWNLDVLEPLDFENSNLEEQLKTQIIECGKLFFGLDYFIFPCGLFYNIPPFAVGRGYWDNWMIYKARHSFVPVIDITDFTMVVHQNHDYSHISGGLEEAYYTGIEAKRNLNLIGGIRHKFEVRDAIYTLTSSGLRLDLSYKKQKQHIYRMLNFFRAYLLIKLIRLSTRGIKFLLRGKL